MAKELEASSSLVLPTSAERESTDAAREEAPRSCSSYEATKEVHSQQGHNYLICMGVKKDVPWHSDLPAGASIYGMTAEPDVPY